MTLSPSDLEELAGHAIRAATEAGEMIARSRPLDIERKPGANSPASQVVTDVDRRSEEIILGILGPTLQQFDFGLLTEERDDDGGRLSSDYFWCIDPLDGTLPFTEGTPGYAVSIALVARDGSPRLGVVYDPVEATLLHAISGVGAFRNGVSWSVDLHTGGEVLSVYADRSFLDRDDHDHVMESLQSVALDRGLTGIELHPVGGAVMNACRVLVNPPACYFKEPKPVGGGSLWDFSATSCLFHEVGAVATDLLGGPLDLNRSDSTFMNHRGVLFATDGALADRIRAVLMGGC